MKKEEIRDRIHDQFKKIDKYFQKMVSDFEFEDIHRFRTETKRLRSFLHLLEMEKEEGIHFNTARKLKTVYGYAGIIRNLQIQISTLKESLPEGQYPNNYLAKLKGELEDWKAKVREYMDTDNNFLDEEALILEKLPDKLRKKSIRQFIQFCMFKLSGLLKGLHEDENIHEFRKIMKDIYYNRSCLEYYMTNLPSGISDRYAAKAAIDMLGRFHDNCVALAMLKTYNDESIGNLQEKEILEKLEAKWEREKQIIKEKASAKLNLLHISTDSIKLVTFVDTTYQ
ncbi:MAG: CHAD domain-containing protein [Bacteroidota bacterium]|nr:CHAD domain-containing protein [Bacteroidota bacterium]